MQTEYLKNILVGDYVLDEEPDIVDIVTRINRNGDLDGTVVEISFRVNAHEPVGKNRFWMAWEQYDEYVACIATNTCLVKDRAILRPTPFEYYNGKNFGNSIDRKFVSGGYWIMEGAGLFWFFGSPVSFLAYFLINAYVQIVTIIGFFTTIIAGSGGGGYD